MATKGASNVLAALKSYFQPKSRRKKRRLRSVLASILVILTVALVYAYVRRPWAYAAARESAWHTRAATVNGQPIMEAEMEHDLRLRYGPDVLETLVEDVVVEQEAARQHVTLDDPQSQRFLQRYRTAMEEKESDFQDRELRVQLLLRKLVLRTVTDAERRDVYDNFKDELAEYELFHIVVFDPIDAAVISKGLKAGQSFDLLADRYSEDLATRRSGGRLGYMTLPDISARFGEQAEQAVVRLSPGGVTRPMPTAAGLDIFKVGQIHRSYDELKPAIDELLASARSEDMLYRLRSTAHVISPYTINAPVETPASSGAPARVFASPTAAAQPSGKSLFSVPTSKPVEPSPILAPPSSQPVPSASSVFAPPTDWYESRHPSGSPATSGSPAPGH